jgi:predicted secreted hydrolase
VKRRCFLLAPLVLAGMRAQAQVRYADVSPDTQLEFPRDHGSHPAFRTEWWYITAWVQDAAGLDLGVQTTFFRNRPGIAESGTSSFAPHQLLFAHAAIADTRLGRLRHDQRAARAGLGLAEAMEGTTDVHIADWSLQLSTQLTAQLSGDTYRARIAARDFALDLTFTAASSLLLQGTHGVSRKGPRIQQASWYYSRPHLAVAGTLTLDSRTSPVRGSAWLDHEWSSAYLAVEARGWDWVGVNFDDGSALMAFRIRAADGGAYWAGGAFQHKDGTAHNLSPAEVAFTPLRRWRSPRTDIEYPVGWRIRAGAIDITLMPVMDDQELDSRASVGTIYWEGAVRAYAGGRQVGRGYLELTGYGNALKL